MVKRSKGRRLAPAPDSALNFFGLVGFLAHCILIAWIMGTVRTSETLIYTYQSTQRSKPEDDHARTRRLENLKTYLLRSYSPILTKASSGLGIL
jgi:hypothetical protein